MRLYTSLHTALIVCLMSTAALADEPRKVDFTTVLTDQDDKPFEECKKFVEPITPQSTCLEMGSLTLGRFAVRALASRFQDEANLSGEEQVKRAVLAQAIYKSHEVALTSDEVGLIKRLIAKLGYNTIAVMRAWKLLDPASVK